MDDLLQEFIIETRETLEALSGEIVAWESNPGDRTRLDAIFRFVHTVKGSCGFLDLPRLERLSHAAEDALAAVRAGDRVPDRRLVDAVLAIVDRIGEIVEAIDGGRSLDDSGEELLLTALEERAAPAPVLELAPQAVPVRTPTRSVRLSVDLLDRMMSGMSEMVLARNELARRLRDEAADPALESALDRLSATVADMRDTVTRTRMQRIEALFSSLPRMVRDLAAQMGKKVSLSIDGADVELDREMIEMMRDPLVHMIRNALDHGLESPAERRAAGKSETGHLSICARQSGNRIIVEVSDDGRGIDTGRLVTKLSRQDPSRAPALHALSEQARVDLVFEPGLTSRDDVTAISGRGVGMDVVRANVEQIGGRIALDNQPGKGLTVSVEVPLTLAILSAVVVSVGDQRFAVPRQAVEEIVAARGGAVRLDALGDTSLVTVRERRLPLVDLGRSLGCSCREGPPAMLVIVDVPGGAYAIGVDGVLDTEELVVKPASPAIMSAGIYAGQTLPDNGVPMLLLDCSGVASRAGLSFRREQVAEVEEAAPAVPATEALVFDDLDGSRRAVALVAVDRIDRVEAQAIVSSGGMWRMVVEGRTVPLLATGPMPERGVLAVLRFHDAGGEIGYVVRSASDIVALEAGIVPALGDGPVLGVTVLDGAAVEVLDPLWVFGQRPAAPAGTPTFRFEGAEAQWMSGFLAPVLEAAGYRRDDAHGEVVLTLDAAATPAGNVVRLSRERDQGVYCYDRAGLVAAVASQVRSQVSGGR